MARARWRRGLDRTRSNEPRPILANALLALREAPEWDDLLSFNEFSQKIRVRGRLPWATQRREEDWTEIHDTYTAEWLQRQAIRVPPQIAYLAIEAVARWFQSVQGKEL